MYEKARIGVDPVILTIQDNKLKVLLQKREKEPFKGKYELLGGLVQKNETAEDCLQRKLKDVLGTSKVFFEQFHTFTNIKRDPRMRTIGISFIALIEKNKIKNIDSWFDVNNLLPTTNPQPQTKLAFDHNKIISFACKYLKENINSLVKQFLPDFFPLNDLQKVHEIITGKVFDNRNFRKQMINSWIVKETKKVEENVSHRPAKLYAFRY